MGHKHTQDEKEWKVAELLDHLLQSAEERQETCGQVRDAQEAARNRDGRGPSNPNGHVQERHSFQAPPPLPVRVSIQTQASSCHKKLTANQKRRLRTARNASLRQDEPSEQNITSGKVRKSQTEHHPLEKVEIVRFDTVSLSGAEGAWVGKVLPRHGPTESLQSYLDKGYTLHEWDGRSSKVFCDNKDCIFACLAHPPNEDGSWDEVVREFWNANERFFESLGPRRHEEERRGDFDSFTAGLSIGQGQTAPQFMSISEHNQSVLDEFHQNPYVKRVLGTADAIFKYYFPKLYRDYASMLQEYHHLTGGLKVRTGGGGRPPHWEPPYQPTVWAAETRNRGPKVVTHLHVDQANKANGICPIFSFGDFNPKTGGHLVLPQLKLVVEFPPGCFIFIPSATLLHGNIQVSESERRGSYTMFTAGGLFRWVAYGGQTERMMKKRDRKRWTHIELPKRPTAWAESMSRFSTTTSLDSDRVYYTSRKDQYMA